MLEQDERIKSHLSRKEKIYGTINQNKYYLEKSLANLDDNLARSSKGFSPGRTQFASARSPKSHNK